MDYLELKINMPQEKVDLVSTFLVTGGYDTFEVSDFSDLMENAGEVFADYVEDDLFSRQNEPPAILFYLEKGEENQAKEIQGFILGVAENLGWEDVSCTLRLVENSDWDTRWKQYFYPFPVGEKLYIKPAWEESDPQAVGDRRVIEIDPAAAFGSGTHATTRLCLEAVDKVLCPGDKVLDMGCGSGILGIGAELLGAGEVVSVDIDETAVRVAQENFAKNGCRKGNTFLCGDVLSSPETRLAMGTGFDLICANIVAQIIREMAPILYDVLKPGGVLLASGILSVRRDEVAETLLSAGFVLKEERMEEDWVCLVLTK